MSAVTTSRACNPLPPIFRPLRNHVEQPCIPPAPLRSCSPPLHEVDHLDAVPGGEPRRREPGPRHQVAVALHGHRPGIAPQAGHQVRHGRPLGHPVGLAVEEHVEERSDLLHGPFISEVYSRCLSSARPMLLTALMINAEVPRPTWGMSKPRVRSPRSSVRPLASTRGSTTVEIMRTETWVPAMGWPLLLELARRTRVAVWPRPKSRSSSSSRTSCSWSASLVRYSRITWSRVRSGAEGRGRGGGWGGAGAAGVGATTGTGGGAGAGRATVSPPSASGGATGTGPETGRAGADGVSYDGYCPVCRPALMAASLASSLPWRIAAIMVRC